MKRQLLLFVTMLMAVIMPMKLWAADGNAEPYAVLSDNNTKLTFFYDDQKEARGGMSVGPFYIDNYPSWYNQRESITTVVFNDSFANCTTLTSTAYWFSGCNKLTTISGIGNLKTNNVTSMEYMFYDCSSLTSLDVSGFNTANVTNMDNMFSRCSGLTSLDVSGFNTTNVTNMYRLFYQCFNLASIDVSNFNTANVTNMVHLFCGCKSLTSLDVSNFNTANLELMSGMFENCSSLTNLDVSNLNTAKVEDMTWLFKGCNNLTNINFGNFDTSNVRSMSEMFSGCSNLTSIDVSSFNTAKVTDIGGMFGGCRKLTSIDLSNFNTLNVDDMSSTFSNCSGLTSLDLSNFSTPNLTGMYETFYGCSGLTSLNLSNFNTTHVTYMGGTFANCSKLENLDISNFNTGNVERMHDMFSGCSSLTTLDLSSFNTEKVWNMHDMFSGCSSLTTIFASSNWSTAIVTESSDMFKNCSAIVGGAGTVYDANHTDHNYAHIDGGSSNPGYFTYKSAPVVTTPEPYAVLSDNNTKLTFFYDDQKDVRGGMDVGPFSSSSSNVVPWYNQRENITVAEFASSFANCTSITSTAYWFDGCKNMVSISGIQYLNTANVTNMHAMFLNCSSLTNLDVSGFNTANVADMSDMFWGCYGLTSLDVSGFNTANVTDMSYMFIDCSGLTSLDVSGFNTANVTDMVGMFSGCKSLTSLDISNLNTANVKSMHRMFHDCSGLISLDVSNFNTSNVTDMSWMFAGSLGLTNLDVSGFKTDNVTDMNLMFYDCSGLTNLDVSGFNTASVTNMKWMFNGCSGLTNLDVSGFNTANVADMSGMFFGCSGLTSLELSNFNTANVTDMSLMFYDCSGLTSLDIRNFDMSKVNNEEKNMFVGCSSLASIIAGNANILAEEYANIANPNLLVYVNDASLAPQGVQNVVINGLAREIVLTDVQDGNNDWYAPQAFVAERISYTRNFGQSTTKGTSRGWESIALPFDVQTIQHESKGVIAPFNNSASNKHFWLRRLTDNGLQAATNIEANTPYIISMPNSEEYTSDYNLNGRVTFSAQNIDVPATTTKVLALADSSIVMVPAMQRQSRSSSVWALNVGEVRGQYFEGSVFERDYRTVRPFEAYTIHRQENGQPAPRYVPIQEIAGVTGIETIDREPLTLNQWYDMQGRKLEGKPARKGVYISNGKKVVVK